MGTELLHSNVPMTKNSILYVEDDLATAKLVKEFLQRESFDVAIVADGELALSRIRSESFDCILLDITLPGLDGLSVCQRIREEYVGGIMMLTARGEESDQVVGLDSGADDYLPKPVQPRLLLARLNALIRRIKPHRRSDTTQEIVVNDLRIEPGQRTVSYQGCAVDVTSTEFDLLWMLARQAGVTVSRNNLHETIRGVRYDGLDRSIDLMIGRIRKKLGDSGRDAKLIKSIHGTGYQLVKK